MCVCVKRRAETGAGEQGSACLDNAAQGFGVCRGRLGNLPGKFDPVMSCHVMCVRHALIGMLTVCDKCVLRNLFIDIVFRH